MQGTVPAPGTLPLDDEQPTRWHPRTAAAPPAVPTVGPPDEQASPPSTAGPDDLPLGEDEASGRRLTGRHLQAIGLVAVVALVFVSYQLLRARPAEVPVVQGLPSAVASTSAPVSPSAPQATPSPTEVQVHVVGAVKKPGVVTLHEGARVHDAIAAAGGLAPAAKLGTLNLAARVVDGMQVAVGDGQTDSGTTAPQPQAPDGSPEAQRAPPGGGGAAPVNLNTATQAQLESLPGVGPVMAGKIIAWRTEHGKFSSVNDLQEVDGVGPKTFERLKPLVSV